METINRVELAENDIIFWPIAIGNQSESKAKEVFTEIMKTYQGYFPNNKIIFFPYKNIMQFYYPIIISPINISRKKEDDISFWKRFFRRK